MNPNEAQIRRLKRRRPRDRFLRVSMAGICMLVAVAWLSGDFSISAVASEKRWQNLIRFLHEIQPYPMRQPDSEPGAVVRWAWDLFIRYGWPAGLATLAIAVAAIVLAGAGGLIMSLPAARSLASPSPFVSSGRAPTRRSRYGWRAVVIVTRAVLIFARAIPEYVWAFLFLAMLGPKAWPAVLALALHNVGILGKLGAEVIEDVEPAVPAALRGLGSSRAQIAVVGLLSLALPRLLVYFFYRWETCVREATVLGLLGFSSLGLWMMDARARDRYDEMVFMVLLGAAIVLVGDLVSAVARGLVRRAA